MEFPSIPSRRERRKIESAKMNKFPAEPSLWHIVHRFFFLLHLPWVSRRCFIADHIEFLSLRHRRHSHFILIDSSCGPVACAILAIRKCGTQNRAPNSTVRRTRSVETTQIELQMPKLDGGSQIFCVSLFFFFCCSNVARNAKGEKAKKKRVQ